MEAQGTVSLLGSCTSTPEIGSGSEGVLVLAAWLVKRLQRAQRVGPLQIL